MLSESNHQDWERIAAIAPPFLHPAFFSATARWLARDATPLVVTAHRANALAAVLPLARRRGRLVALGSLHTPRYDVVAEPDAIPELWRVLRDDHRWHTLELPGVPATSRLATELVTCALADGFPVERLPGSRAPYFALDHDFERRLAGRFRRNLLARRRAIPALSFECVTTADPDALDDVFRLEAAAWKGEAGTAITSTEETRTFYRELAHELAPRGSLALCFLRSGARRIAAHFSLVDHRTYYLLKPGYDPAFAKYGPGHVLVYEAARHAIERGLVEFDFLGQDMEWKRSWTNLFHPHVDLFIYRRNLRGRCRHTLRHVVRPMLGRTRRRLTLRDRARSSPQG